MSNTRPGSLKTEQLDMESLFDFSQSTTQPSPATASSSKVDATPKSAYQDWISPFDQQEQRQFSGPSHDYNQYKQQVGLPTGGMANMPQQSMFDGYSSGIGDVGMDSGFGGWNSGIDLDAEMTLDFNNPSSSMPAMFFPPSNNGSNGSNQTESFVDPSNIGAPEEPTSHVGRLWPGMHSQQAQAAAMQKAAQVQAVQQRQLKLQAQQAQYRQANNSSQSQSSSQGHSKRPSTVTEPHVEESISRLLNQMRQNSNAGPVDDEDSPSNGLPHLARMKKDEDEMDEDERLLASEEGKKLSSKERRQLRNKVSARAFRSRRKEYIGQLEGEVAMKAQEAATLRSQNAALMHENDNYRALIETLLRHPSFSSVLADFSQDPSNLLAPRQQPQQQQQQSQQQRPSATPTQQPAQPQQPQQQPQQDSKPEYMNFDASQLQIPQQQQTEQVGLAMIPENDFSKLNINGFNGINFNNYQRVNAFPVTDLPAGPDPVDLLATSPYAVSAATSNFAASSAFDSTNLNILLAKLDGAANRTMDRSTITA